MRPHYSERFGYPRLKAFARKLRKNQTEAEEIFWKAVRNRKFRNLKFRRQHQIGFYIVDFYCVRYQLIVELDGEIHNRRENEISDEEREWNLDFKGFRLLRFPNDRILNDLETVLREISNYVDTIDLT